MKALMQANTVYVWNPIEANAGGVTITTMKLKILSGYVSTVRACNGLNICLPIGCCRNGICGSTSRKRCDLCGIQPCHAQPPDGEEAIEHE